MKLSNKEKVLLSVLGGLLIGVIYYQFVYSKQIDKISELEQQKIEIETEYNELMDTIARLEEREENVKSLLSDINFNTKTFYPEIVQENIILELDKYLDESTLQGDISFSEVSVQAVEKFEAKLTDDEESTFENFVNQYNGTSNTTQVDNQEIVLEDGTEQESNSTIEMLTVTLNYKGTYECLKKFISNIEVSNREILITDLSMSVGSNGELTGSMTLEFYSIPKLSTSDNEYLEWSIDGTYGTSMPFLVQSSETQDSTEASSKVSSDFAAIVKSINSDLPSIMIGKSDATDQSTYISTTNNNSQDGEMIFNLVDNKYYCKYSLGSNIYSTNYNGSGISFDPTSENIIIEVTSEVRTDADDKSGLNLKVTNNTDKIVEVIIVNDDDNHRVSINGDSAKVKVTRK